MNVIARRTLVAFWTKNPQAEAPLKVWYAEARAAQWTSPQDVKDRFGASVDFLADNRVVFDIGGNKFRLIVRVAYKHKRILIKFVGTHAECDRIDAATI
jgi:mRNA interferase HigB